jgi:glucosaminylphosphatidylinositol acyltransferase
MDSGVALVMIFSGATNPLVVKQDLKQMIPSFTEGIYKAFASNKLVVLAASIRFFLLTGIDYHDHVTEWGVHWNFFMTIACLNVMGVFIRSSKYAIVYAIGILMIQEFIQIHWDLKTYIYHAPRNDLVSANREGIVSILGYFALQLVGIFIGREVY